MAWKCPKCDSTDTVLWRSCSESINEEGEKVDSMWIGDLFYKCQDCEHEWNK